MGPNGVHAYSRKKKAKILIVDEHPIVREGWARLISGQPEMQVVGGLSPAGAAQFRPEVLEVDLMILGLSLTRLDGFELIKSLKARQPALPVFVISVHDKLDFVNRALDAGAAGYATKDEEPEELLGGVRALLRGETFLSQRIKEMKSRSDLGDYKGAGQLSDRELSVFAMIGEGASTRDIADRLHVSVKTIETHRENIKRKLGIATSPRLIVEAARWNFRKQPPLDFRDV